MKLLWHQYEYTVNLHSGKSFIQKHNINISESQPKEFERHKGGRQYRFWKSRKPGTQQFDRGSLVHSVITFTGLYHTKFRLISFDDIEHKRDFPICKYAACSLRQGYVIRIYVENKNSKLSVSYFLMYTSANKRLWATKISLRKHFNIFFLSAHFITCMYVSNRLSPNIFL